MSIKTTQQLTRQQAMMILNIALPKLPNDTLATLLDTIADSGQSQILSKFDNFIVSDFAEPDSVDRADMYYSRRLGY